MKIEILTIFPQLFESVFSAGMVWQGSHKQAVEIEVTDLRQFTNDRHRTVDDRPYGGGEGMVLKPEPIFKAVDKAKEKCPQGVHVVLLTPQGQLFNQGVANRLVQYEHLILICGRYEGVDQRVADHLVDEEISIGDFVLTGGEIPAMLVTDAVTRLIPGVVGNPSSVLEDSFMNGILDYPHYTRPSEFRGYKVPSVLLSGDHGKVQVWREEQADRVTLSNRPDLFSGKRDTRCET